MEVDDYGVTISRGRQSQRIEFESIRSIHLHEISAHGFSSRAVYLVAKSGAESSFGLDFGSPIADAEFNRAVATMLNAFDTIRAGAYIELTQPTRSKVLSTAGYAGLLLVVMMWSVISWWPLNSAEYAALVLSAVVAAVVGFRNFGSPRSNRRVLASQLAKDLAERSTF